MDHCTHKGVTGLNFQIKVIDVLQSLLIVFILASSADPYEMQHSAALHLAKVPA